MTESFLHYIWKFKLFNQMSLKTTNGEQVQIFKAGEHNTNAGPDFFNAKIKIGDTIWAGNVEIHIKSSNWNDHKHQLDLAYNNSILHVSFEHDTEVKNHMGQEIPAIELKNLIDPKVIEQYHSLQKPSQFIPCEKNISGIDHFILQSWLDRMLIERLERKSDEVKQLLAHTNNNWEETLYISLARNFGFHINADAFEMLAKSIPLAAIQKHKNDITQIEALLFGQASLLKEEFTDHYTKILAREYRVLRSKFNLTPLDYSVWKFLRLRPSNFPTIRIAQFAQLLHKKDNLFSEIIEAENVNILLNLFTASVSDYWNRHYVFDKMLKYSEKSLGSSSAELIIINTIVPFLFVYGQQKNKEEHKDKALKLLEQLKPEKNSIIENWEQWGIKVESAYRSQALLQLKNEYCSHKKCLNCSIFNSIIR